MCRCGASSEQVGEKHLPVVSPERRKKLAQLLVRKAAAVESIGQEHRAYFFRRQAGDPIVISNERMGEMLDELFV